MPSLPINEDMKMGKKAAVPKQVLCKSVANPL